MTSFALARRGLWALSVALSLALAAAGTPTIAATIRTEVQVDVAPDLAWAALRDVAAVHTRLARGFVVDTTLADGIRTVTFAPGTSPLTVKERIVTVDDETRRLAYGAIESRATFHSASIQVFPHGKGSRLVWVTDVLPDAFGERVRGNMQRGMAAMKITLEQDAKANRGSR